MDAGKKSALLALHMMLYGKSGLIGAACSRRERGCALENAFAHP